MVVLCACEESQRVCTAFRAKGHNAFSCDLQEPSGGHPEWHIKCNVLEVLNPESHWGWISEDESVWCGIEFTTMDGAYHRIEGCWDLIIAFPPCTYLSNAGACRLYPRAGELDQDRYEKGMQAKEFFMKFWNAKCDKICIENPMPSKIFGLPEKTQVIQPYEFGHPYTKKTYLWLKGLPPLMPIDKDQMSIFDLLPEEEAKKYRPVKADDWEWNVVDSVGTYVCGNSETWKKQAARGTVCGKEKNPKYRSKTFEGIAAAMAEQWG